MTGEMVKNKSKLFSLILLLCMATHAVVAKEYPKDFSIKFDLYHSKKNIGQVDIKYIQNNKDYEFKASLKTKGILKLFGDREFHSIGLVKKEGFLTKKFEIKNLRNRKKNILVKTNLSKKNIEITYKNKKNIKSFLNDPQDLISLLFQFNYKDYQDEYTYEIIEGKSIKKFRYEKLDASYIKDMPTLENTDLYKGEIIGQKNTIHYLWISKHPYRIPLKARIKTNFGLLVDLKLVETSLNFK